MTALVMPARRGDNEELRYALRAACAHLPHDELWLIGEGPDWVKPTGRIVPERGASKWQTIRNAFEVVAGLGVIPDGADAAADAMPDEMVWMDDDTFIMQPWTGSTYYLDGPTNPSSYTHTHGLHDAGVLLRNLEVRGPYRNYEVHAPMPMSRERLSDAMRWARGFKPHVLHARTLYGNLFAVGGQQTADFKIRRAGDDLDRPILSTSDRGFASLPVGKRIRAAFPDPCEWEAP